MVTAYHETIFTIWYYANGAMILPNTVFFLVRLYQTVVGQLKGEQFRVREKYHHWLEVFHPLRWDFRKEVVVSSSSSSHLHSKKNDDAVNFDDSTNDDDANTDDSKSNDPSPLPYKKPDIIDYYGKFIILYHILHFWTCCILEIVDCGLMANWTQKCKFWLFIHHFFAPFAMKAAFMLDHYPLFILFPTCYHAVVIYDSSLWFNPYVYGTGLFIQGFYPFAVKEYRQNKVIQAMFMLALIFGGAAIFHDVLNPFCGANFKYLRSVCTYDEDHLKEMLRSKR